MAQNFEQATLTNSGADLLNQAQSGEIKLEFTRICVGNGIYSDEEKSPRELQLLTELKSPKNSYPIASKSRNGERQLKITTVLTNADSSTNKAIVTEGFYITEMGLYCRAKDDPSTEVLYSVTVIVSGTGDYMPPFNGKNLAEITQEWFTTISNDAEVYVQYTPGSWAPANILDDVNAETVPYNNSDSEINATNVQEAIDLMAESVSKLNKKTAELEEKSDGLEFGISENGCLTITYDDGSDEK